MVASTVHEAIDQVAAFFDANKLPCPLNSVRDKVDFEVNILMNGYKNKDPLEKHEVDISPFFLRKCYNRAVTKKEKHMSILLIIAFFLRDTFL